MIKSISIILPTLNEQGNIFKIYEGIKKEFIFNNYDLIFVDDGSIDLTRKNILKLANKHKNINYVFRENDKDLSRSFIEGLIKSNSEYIIMMDSDLQHNPKDLNKLIKIIEQEDAKFVIGSRFLDSSLINGSFLYKFLRINLSKFVIFILYNFLDIKLSDPLSGFFIIKKETFLIYKNNLYKSGWKIMLDFYLSSKKNLDIFEVPISIDTRKEGYSKLNLNVFINLIKLLFHHYKTR